ncbi:zinc finger protein RFP-like [Tiliqua scincoides]|uniref:zinc finger protein RFP-like n=1 Tax=Tiliqua scincoides TaxID=71010 RepID=UPI003461F181
MAAPSPRKRLQEEATCPICLDYFRDPVSLDCGHNFCRGCILQSWGESPVEAACPQCRERVQTSNLRPNRQLASVVEAVKELSESLKLEASAWRVCERHQEPLKLFCQDDEAPICVVCDRSKEHRPHLVVPVEEAAQEYKDQICSQLQVLRKEREKILKYKADTEKESQDLLKQTEAERMKMVAVFRRLHQFLEEQEKLLLAQVDEVEKEIATRKNEHMNRLSEELSTLERIIQEMEEKCQQPASEFLEDVRSTLQRCQRKEMPDNSVTFPPALKWRIWEFWDLNPFLASVMGQFEDTLVAGLQLQKANVTLDPGTAHPKFILSEDHKSMREGGELQALPNNPERFNSWPAVLGHEGFTAGRHFWEFTVGREGTWAMGVARKSVRRKGYFDFSPEEGIWLLEKWAIEVLKLPNSLSLSQSAKPQRVRVVLNHAGRRVAFFDADSATLLYTILDTSFSGETLYPFFLLYGKARLTLS